MGKRYAILYGKTGVKNFRKRERAVEWGKKKANQTGKAVDLDRITTYPKAKPGMTDWSQKTVATIKPKKKR